MAKLHDHINTVFVGQEVALCKEFKRICGLGLINRTVKDLIQKYVTDFHATQTGESHDRHEPRTKAA